VPEGGPSGHASAERVSVAGYEVLQELGRGGMGVVYKARQKGLNRLVALKMILSGMHAGPEDLGRFKAEAELIAQLRHPHIVQIYEVGEQEGLPFFSLEFCSGGTLDRKLAGTPLPPREAAALAEKLARATHAAHDKGVLHRDLKPANVLLDEHGEPKITDFGLAKRIDAPHSHTLSGSVLGTPSYMAPEQAAGRVKEIARASDVYALGAVLYECLTGRPPFRAATAFDTLLQVIQDEPVPPTRLQGRIPRDLETVVLKCLQKEARKRYASALDLADDLRRFLDGRPITGRPVGRLERGWRWCKRNPVVAGLSGSIAAAVLVAVGLLAAERTATLHNLDRALTAESERSEQLYKALVAQAEAGRFSRRAGQRFTSLAAIREAARLVRERGMPAERLARLRDLAVACLALPDVRLVREWDSTTSLDVNNRLDLYAQVDQDGTARVRRVADDQETAALAGDGRPALVHFTEDGPFVLLRSVDKPPRVKVWRPGEAEPRSEFAVEDQGDVTAFRTDVQGRRLFVGHAGGVIGVYELPSGRRLHQIRTVADELLLEVDPGGRWLAVVAGKPGSALRRTIHLFDLDTGLEAGELSYSNTVTSCSWHPDGRRLIVGYQEPGEIRVWDVPSRRMTADWAAEGGAPFVLCNRTGDLVAASSPWSSHLLLYHPQTGRQLLRLPGTHLPCDRAAADGRLACLRRDGDKLQLWEINPGREYRTLVRNPGETLGVSSVHPGGRLLAAPVSEGKVLTGATGDGVGLWDLSSGQFLRLLAVGAQQSAQFDAAGNLLTCGVGGTRRWPVRADPESPDSLTVGPPEVLPTGLGLLLPMTASRDGSVLAFTFLEGCRVWRAARPLDLVPLVPDHDVRQLGLSPDGSLVATASHSGQYVRVWDAVTGRRIRELPKKGEVASACFSPDGRWLAVQNEKQVVLWDVRTWQARGSFAGNFFASTFSPDGRLLALEQGTGITRLVDWGAERELALLEAPGQERHRIFTFSPDGSQLLSPGEHGELHVWDLRLLREDLVPLGLEGDLPEFPPGDPKPLPPLRLTVQEGQRAFVEAPPPGVIRLPDARRQEPGQVARWLRGLAGEEAAEAMRGLEQAGEAALPALKQAIETAPGPLRPRLEDLRDRILAAETAAGRRVRLKLVAASRRDAMRELARQTGLGLEYRPPPGAAPPEPGPVTLVLDGVSPWEAVDRYCEAAGLTPSVRDAGSLFLSDGRPRPAPRVAHAGPFRLQAASWTYAHREGLLGEPAAPDSLVLSGLRLDGPLERPLWVGEPRVESAVDDRGRSLLAPARPPAAFVPVRPDQPGGTFQLALQPPDGLRQGTARWIRGVLPVEVLLPQKELLGIADLSKVEGKNCFAADGLMLTPGHLEYRAGLTQVTVRLNLSGPPGWHPVRDREAVEVRDARGRQATVTGEFSARVRLGFRQEDLAVFGPAPAGEWSSFPLVGLALSDRFRSTWEGYFTIALPGGATAPLRLSLVRAKRVRVELPFEFRDVPLP
jgi:WD40 repeat protein/tRNA A-37 threonylcarbamoyl transferase component Bud32